MKHYIKLFSVGMLIAFSSCVDDDKLAFDVEKPESIAQYEYLNKYDVLKAYIDRAANPNFKLGVGVAADWYAQKKVDYSLTNDNFDEVTPGNHMKYGFCVAKDGSMDFSVVSSFVERAKAAGISVYGHTLCWQLQQQNDYLKKLVAPMVVEGAATDPFWEDNVFVNAGFESDDETSYTIGNTAAILAYTAVGGGANGEGRALTITNSQRQTNDWDAQLFLTFPSMPLVLGETYEFSMNYKADDACSFPTQAHFAPGDYLHWNMFGEVSPTTEWRAFKKEFTVTSETAGAYTFAFNLGHNVTTYYFDNISLRHYNKGVSNTAWVEQLTGGDFESDNFDVSFQINGSGVKGYTTGSNGEGRALSVTTPSVCEADWGSQLIFRFSPAMQLGETYEFSMDVKADSDRKFSTQTQRTPGEYQHWTAFGEISATTEWKTFKYTLNVSSDFANGGAIAFNFGLTAGAVYFDNISFKKETAAGAAIEKSDEEKKSIVSAELERWIAGMMEACGGYVKAWDVVNEPLSGSDSDGDGYYDPWSASNASPEDAAASFYWRDYLGELDFVRLSVEYARRYFAQYGGNASELKLFVNEYNLESDWDDNRKLKGLIEWINRWEADGVTKIDGIGSQMHVSCYADPATQQSKQEHVVKMLELLAASGKLIKITELDMGYIDADGTNVMAADMSFEQHQAMAEFYNFIIRKYFEKIPVPQQYGITQWCTTDSPTNSGWRAGEPVGLWDLNYHRKPAYGGFANGLAGKDVSRED